MQAKLSITRACQLAGLSRAAYYKRPTPASEIDALVIDALNAIVTRHGRWGFWKCYTRLRLDGHCWNKKRVHRVYCDMGLNLPRRRKKAATRAASTAAGFGHGTQSLLGAGLHARRAVLRTTVPDTERNR